MKPLLNFIFAMLLVQVVYSQETTLVTKDNDDYYEEYSVLQTDRKVKHGDYAKLSKGIGFAIESTGTYVLGQKSGYWESYFGRSNNIKESGFYKNDFRDSTWVFFYPEGENRKLVEVESDDGPTLQVSGANPIVAKTGRYSNGKLIGVWEYFDEYGQLNHKFDHDHRVLVFFKGQSLDDHDSGFIGGDVLLLQYLYDTFDFDAVMNSINRKIWLETGKLVFKFTIDENGLIKDLVCTEQTVQNNKIYNRAVETIESLNNQFYPKRVNGNNQSTTRTITFDLNAKDKSSYRNYETSVYRQTVMSFKLQIKVDK